MATPTRTTHRKTRWSTPPPRPFSSPHAQPYRRRRPETTSLHRIARENLETYLTLAKESDPMGDGVPDHVETEFRSYLKCGILADGFARARCSGCGYEFLVAFSCKGRGACPSCNAKRMAETAAHLADHVIPHVPVRQWVLSVPKRLRPFLHRFGSSLNPHFQPRPHHPDPGPHRRATSPPLIHLAPGPPQTEIAMGPLGPDGGTHYEAAQDAFPDDLDQPPRFDPAEPEPIAEDHFDPSWAD